MAIDFPSDTRDYLRRFDAAGHQDPSYGGTVTLSFDQFTVARARIGRDGRVYVGDLRGGANVAHVTRFTTDGHLDEGWADHGTLVSPVGPTYPPLPGRTADADAQGRLILSGITGEDRDFVVARYRADGTGLDPTFGDDGLYKVPVPDVENADAANAGAVGVDPQGRIVLAGSFGNGKKVKTLKGKRITAPVNLRGLPKGKVTVSISVKLSDGKTLKGTRKYKTCVPKGRAQTIPVL